MAKRNREAKKAKLPLIRRKWYLRIFWYIWHYVLDIRVFFSMSRFLETMEEGSQIGLKARRGFKKKNVQSKKKKKQKKK